MLRKQIRLKREYLYHKENENKIKKKIQKKQIVKNAHENNKRLHTELFREEKELSKELEVDDENTLVARTHIDDEYGNNKESRILITTCRTPSSRLAQFLKEMSVVLPNATRINRGAYVLQDIIDMAIAKQQTDLVILHEHRGEPDGMIVSHLPLGPTVYFGLTDVVLRHDLKEKAATMSEALPHLLFEGFSTALGHRLTHILQHLFPPPKISSKRVITFANHSDSISFRHHVYSKDDYKTVVLNEVGPRFTMKPYQISLGLLNQPHAHKEWVIKPFINTAHKSKAF